METTNRRNAVTRVEHGSRTLQPGEFAMLDAERHNVPPGLSDTDTMLWAAAQLNLDLAGWVDCEYWECGSGCHLRFVFRGYTLEQAREILH